MAMPTTDLVEDAEIRVECVRGEGPEVDIYAGIGNGTVRVHNPTEKSRFANQATIHIVWEFVNEAPPYDTFTFIETGVAQVRVAENGDEFPSVSGHSTARPGDGALQYGRWVLDFTADEWINRGHTIGCTFIPPPP
jgi:hypothetical protein